MIEDGALVMKTTRIPSGTYELHLGKGRALLSLEGGTFVAPDPASGALALEVLAKWLDVPVPAKTHSRPLQPLAFKGIELSEKNNKVFFERGAENAEMYINLRDDGRIEFVPKDSDYAVALADMFADALRDGPAPPRTKQTDPNLETEDTLFSIGRELDPKGAHEAHCFADGWFVLAATTKGESVWFASWGSAPARVCDLPGAVDGLAIAARGPIGVGVVTARDPTSGVVGGKQTATLWRITPTSCRAITTPKDLSIGPFTFVFVSPTGAELALTDNTTLVTLPVDKGTSTRTPVGDLELIYTWNDDGIELHDLSNHVMRVRPGQPPAKIDHHTTISPDGAYTVILGNASLDIVDRAKHTTRTFKPAFRSDIRAIQRAAENAPEWVAPHSLVLRGSPDLVLDAMTLRMRPLIDPAGRLVCVSSDGRHALVEKADVLYESK